MFSKTSNPETIEELLHKKNLDPNLFKKKHSDSPELNDPIEAHIRWAFNHIYSVPYPVSNKRNHPIAREIHGIAHVSRAAFYAKVFANLYRKHGDKEAALLTEEDLKLIQLALIFHDSARENEGVDSWDNESATFLYCYLTKILKVDANKAKLFAEAAANKDSENKYHELHEDDHGHITWTVGASRPKNIYQIIIHDCDCLDILRARLVFDAHYLDFYKKIACQPGKELAFEEMAKLITEARSFIALQGDSYDNLDLMLKQQFEHAKVYTAIQEILNPALHVILTKLSKEYLSDEQLETIQLVDLTPYQPEKGLTEENLQAALRQGELAFRGVAIPSAIPVAQNLAQPVGSAAAIEITKFMRTKGITTRSSKADRFDKEGNPNRSVSIMYGNSTYTSSGFLIVGLDEKAIKAISETDLTSTRGKKKHGNFQLLSSDEIRVERLKLMNCLKMGGREHPKYKSTHTETIYDLSKVNAIFYNKDPNSFNSWLFNNNKMTADVHPYVSLLQAIY